MSKMMKKGVSLVVFLLAVCLVFSACGNIEAAGVNIGVYGMLYAPLDVWDPSINFDQGMQTLHNMYETLLRYNPETDDFTYVLAEGYEKSDDGLTWTFRIRPGVTFHDGTPVNAAAVKYSFERTVDIGLGAAFIWDPVERFEVIDEYTLAMHLNYTAPMDLVVSSPFAAFVFSPTTVEMNGSEWFNEGNEAGSGPYIIQSATMGEQLILRRYEDYWGGWKDNQFDRVVLQKVSEAATRRLMLERGEADIVYELPAEDVEALKSNPNLVVEINPSFENLFMMMNCAKGPLKDVKVRQALSYAFPYDDVIEYVMGGTATKATGPIPAGLWGQAAEGQVFTYYYDLEKAKQLLTEAGYPEGGFTLMLTYVTGDEIERKTAELFQSECNKLGINIDIRPVTADMLISIGQSPNPDNRQDLSLVYWWPDVPGPYTYLYSIYHQSDPISWNWTYYENDVFDALIDKANEISGADREAAIEMFIEAQRMIAEDAPAIICFDKQYMRAYRRTLGGYEDNPAYPHVVFFYDCFRK